MLMDVDNSSKKNKLADYLNSVKLDLEFKQKLFCEALFSTRVSFQAVQHQAWANFFKEVCPEFKVPSEYLIKSKFLPLVYGEKVDLINKSINSSEVTCLLIDSRIAICGRIASL